MSYWSGAYDRILEQLAETKRKSAMSTRSGYVKEIKTGKDGEQKVRMVWGISPDGKEVLSPWLHTTNMRGEERERRAFKVGQNVRMQAPDGDYRQAYLTHGPEGDSTPAPDHAEKVGKEGTTTQNGKTRTTNINGMHNIWIAKEDSKPPEHKPQDGKTKMQGEGGGGGSGGEAGGDKQQEEKKERPPGLPGASDGRKRNRQSGRICRKQSEQ